MKTTVCFLNGCFGITWKTIATCIDYMGRVKDGATLAFCENGICRNLKTNEVKYIKVFIFRKEISQGIYLNSQIFG